MNIKKEYKQSWNYIGECKIHILIIVLLFLASVLLGFLFPVFFVDFIKKFIEEIIKKTGGLDFFQLFLFISKNNLATAFVGLIAGVIFGIIPLFYAFFNGYVLGFVINKGVSALGIGVLWRLVPHGIFELPALVLSLGAGLKLGTFIFGRKKSRDFIYYVKNSFKVFIFIIVPLLLIAAVIEAGLIILLG
jgi:stage II sporulation protein M